MTKIFNKRSMNPGKGIFLFGLIGHCLIEVASRAFYAQQNALIPSIASAINLGLYVLYGIIFSKFLQAPGLGLADSLAFGTQSILLIIMLIWYMAWKVDGKTNLRQVVKTLFTQSAVNLTLIRTLIGSLLGGAIILVVQPLLSNVLPSALAGGIALLLGACITLPFIWKEMRIFLHL